MIGMFVNSLSGLFGVILGKRWNLQWGIPDGVLYWVTDTGFGDVAFTFTQMPAQILFTEINPPNVEAMVVAI